MHRVARFVGIGVVSTLVYALLFLLLATLVATVARSVALSFWVFRGRSPSGSGRRDPVLSLDTQGT